MTSPKKEKKEKPNIEVLVNVDSEENPPPCEKSLTQRSRCTLTTEYGPSNYGR